MGKAAPWVVLLCFWGVLIGVAVHHPGLIDDKNTFLKDFVDADMLAVQGVMCSISIASAANVYLHVNTLSERTGLPFDRVRTSLRRSGLSLVLLFALGLSLIASKPLAPQDSIWIGMVNSLALVVLYMNVSIMWDLTSTTFSIPSADKIMRERPKNTIT